MSITLEDIEVRRVVVDGMVSFEARLKLMNKSTIPVSQFKGMPKEIEERVVHDLVLSIIAHVYGDLIDPVNELYVMLKYDIKVPPEKINTIMDKINRILKGKYQEPLDS